MDPPGPGPSGNTIIRSFVGHQVKQKLTYLLTESLSFLGPKIWNLVPEEIKTSETVDIFKNKIKKWIPENCPCRLCKTYVRVSGFVNKSY